MKKFYLLFVAILITALPLRADIVDELTASNVTFASTSSGYKDFTVTAANSGATYSGNANKVTTKFQFNATSTGIYVSKVPDGLKLKSISLTYNTSDNGSGTLSLYGSTSAYTSFSDITGTALMTTESKKDASYTFSSNETAFALKGSGNASYWSKITVTWEEAEKEGVVSKPTISGPKGLFFDSADITLTTTTEGASIYYLLNSSDTPSATNGTLYTEPFAITATTTVSAIAVKTGSTDSDVSTATFNLGTTFSSIADLKSGDPKADTQYRISGPLTVTYVNTDKGDMLLTDATDATSGIFISGNDNVKSTSVTAGATLSNVVGTYTNSEKFVRPQFTLDSYTLGTATAEVKPTLYESTTALAEKYGQYVRLEAQEVTDGKIGDITLYDRYQLNHTLNPAPDTYDIEGLYLLYGTTPEIYPTAISLHKVTATEVPAAPTVSYNQTNLIIASGASITTNLGGTIYLTATDCDAIEVTATIAGETDATVTTFEGSTGSFTLPDVASVKYSVVAINSVGRSAATEFTFNTAKPTDLKVTSDDTTLEADGSYEFNKGDVVTLTATGATSFSYIAPDATEATVVENGVVTISTFGDYTFMANNAGGSVSLTATITKKPGAVYSLVTSTDDINSDAKYIIAASGAGKAMGTTNSNNSILPVDATFNSEQSTVTVDQGKAAEFTISAVDGGGYTFAIGQQYLAPATSANLNYSATSTTLTVTITNGAATIAYGTARQILYYTKSDCFKHYSTSNATSSDYATVQLYKYDGIENTNPGEDLSVSEIAADVTDLSGAEYYGLNGVRVAASRLTPGLYIVRLPNGTARKTLVK